MSNTPETEPQILAEGQYFRMVVTRGWEHLQHKGFEGVVLLVPITNDGRLVLVEQHRVPIGTSVIELPAGLVGDVDDNRGETMDMAARRELIEETGYDAEAIEEVTEAYPSAGAANWSMHVYVCSKLKQVGPGGGDATEDITVHEVHLGEVHTWLDRQRQAGKAIDLKVYAGLYFAERAMRRT
jgi:ADP-ribose pyrophosphatase